MVSLNRNFSPKKPARAAAKKPQPAGQAVELEIALRYIKPRIWRRFVVPGNIKLHKLHAVIQTVMGWTDSHLHSFRLNSHEYVQVHLGDSDWQQSMGDTIIHDERKHPLGDLIAAKGDKFDYVYDFGDDWEHEIKVKSILPSPEPLKFAFCVLGARACPPEDCGGPYGYEELCTALANPKYPEYEHWKEWIGDYDPGHFDVQEVNWLLSRVRV